MLPKPTTEYNSVYLIGPMRKYQHTHWGRPYFERAAKAWREAGWKVISPIECDDAIGGPDVVSQHRLDETALRDLGYICSVDAVVVSPEWEESSIGRVEIHFAQATGKRLYNEDGTTFWPHKSVHDNPPVHAPVNTGEVRVVSSTGGAKGTKLARYDLIPPGPLHLLAEHYGKGAAKYGDDNWTKGYDWSLNFAALQRHAWAFWGGEDNDPENGSPHMVAVAWHALTLLAFATMHPEFDNRRKS